MHTGQFVSRLDWCFRFRAIKGSTSTCFLASSPSHSSPSLQHNWALLANAFPSPLFTGLSNLALHHPMCAKITFVDPNTPTFPLAKGTSLSLAAKLAEPFLFPFFHQSLDRRENNSNTYCLTNVKFAGHLRSQRAEVLASNNGVPCDVCMGVIRSTAYLSHCNPTSTLGTCTTQASHCIARCFSHSISSGEHEWMGECMNKERTLRCIVYSLYEFKCWIKGLCKQ